jgi:hypothetical protein
MVNQGSDKGALCGLFKGGFSPSFALLEFQMSREHCLDLANSGNDKLTTYHLRVSLPKVFFMFDTSFNSL